MISLEITIYRRNSELTITIFMIDDSELVFLPELELWITDNVSLSISLTLITH